MKDRLVYFISIALPVLALGGDIVILMLCMNGVLSFTFLLIAVAISSILFLFTRESRVESRQRAEAADPDKNPAYGYKYRSKKERMAIDMMTYQANEAALSEKEYRGMVKKGSKYPDKDLEGLIGLSNVKDRVKELQAEFKYKNKKDEITLNMCFLGNPGTGKTTVAGIIASIMYKAHALKSNEYVVVDGATLVSSADPIRRVNLLLKRSKGKLLFIDEAYALAMYPQVGAPVLSTLINEMENDRKRTVIVFAGYKKEMQQLFILNSGLESRIRSFLFFEDYNSEQMLQIEVHCARKRGYEITDEALYKSLECLDYMKRSGTFANARSARNIIEDSISKHLARVYEGSIKEKDRLLTEDDIQIVKEKDDYFFDMSI